jgi:hypothetical protein
MSDQPQRPERKRQGCLTCLVALFVAMCVSGIALCMGLRYAGRQMEDAYVPERMNEAIQAFISERHEWPKDWGSLAPYFATLERAEDGEASRAYGRIEVNFQIDIRKAPQPTDWYVHLRSPGNQGQEDEMNYSLRRRIIKVQEDLRKPPNGGDTPYMEECRPHSAA